MAAVEMEITVVSATGLQDVTKLFKMKSYVVVFISSNPQHKLRTHVDASGGTNPIWDRTLEFSLSERELRQRESCLVFHLYCKKMLIGSRYLGHVRMPIGELLNRGEDNRTHHVEYPITSPFGILKGSLKFSFKFGDRVAVVAEAEAGDDDDDDHEGRRSDASVNNNNSTSRSRGRPGKLSRSFIKLSRVILNVVAIAAINNAIADVAGDGDRVANSET